MQPSPGCKSSAYSGDLFSPHWPLMLGRGAIATVYMLRTNSDAHDSSDCLLNAGYSHGDSPRAGRGRMGPCLSKPRTPIPLVCD